MLTSDGIADAGGMVSLDADWGNALQPRMEVLY